MSRLGAIQTAVGVHVTSAFTAAGETVTLAYDPNAFDSSNKSDFPMARILFAEQEPERLPFKQERRRVNGQVAICMLNASREDVNAIIEDIRDRIFGDERLSSTVDDIRCDAGFAISNPKATEKIYGTIDISTEEIF